MTSAIIRVATAQPSDFSQLGDVQYYTAPDVVTALRDAQQYRDINKLVTVATRVYATRAEAKERLFYLSDKDSEFVEQPSGRAEAYRFGYDAIIPMPLISEEKIHWLETPTGSVYPSLCPDNDALLHTKWLCPVCKALAVGRGFTPGETNLIAGLARPSNHVLRTRHFFNGIVPLESGQVARFLPIAPMMFNGVIGELLTEATEEGPIQAVLQRTEGGIARPQTYSFVRQPLHINNLKETLASWALLMATFDIELHQYHVVDSVISFVQNSQSLQFQVQP